jgi:phenylacetate-CoA ligase
MRRLDVHSALTRHVVYPLALGKRGDWAQLAYIREFERTQFLSPDAIRTLQAERLRALLDHAYHRCPFYRDRFDAAGLHPRDVGDADDLVRMPPLEKREIQAHRDRLVAEGWPRGDLIANQTGGSTGSPISFYLSHDRKRSRAAGTVRHNRWAGWDVGDKVACIWGAPRDLPPAGWRTRLRNALLERQLFLDTGHVTEEKLAAFHEALKRFRPQVILAYARSAELFARYVRARGLNAYQPRSIVTSAEVLEPAGRALLEEVFGCPVFNRYGCREVSVVASECPAHRGLHTMAEGLLVEVVRADGSPAPAGELGSILVTDLLNFAMPLIRYRIGDMGSWEPGDCPCGRGLPRLRGVAGRVTDFLIGGDGRMVSGVFLATYVVAQRPSLGQVQIVQDEPGRSLFRVKPGPGFRAEADLQYLTAATREHLGPDMRVDHEIVDELPTEPSGKFLFCRSRAIPAFLGGPSPAAAVLGGGTRA